MLLINALVFLSHLHVLLILSFAASSFAPPSSSNATDEEALLDFSSKITYDPTNTIMGMGMGSNTNWSSGANFCDWVGVTCSKRRQRVTALNFYNMGLEGTISPYVGNLSFLVSIVLANNSFHGHIPYELGRLRRLKTLVLESNRLEGSIPPTLHNCFKLEVVSLATNMLSDGIPEELGTLQNLRVLVLAANSLDGVIPVSIGNMSALETFELYENKFAGQIPSSLSHCTRLRTLDLTTNKLNGSVPTELGTLQKLEQLSLGANYLSSTIPACLGNISSLKELSLNDNNIHGGIPDELGKLTKLETLNLEYNFLTGSIPHSIFNISSLTRISIVNNSISGDLPTNTGLWLPNLQVMYFALNRIGGRIPAYLSNSSKLSHLDLGDNLFTGPIPSSLGNLPRLVFLNMEKYRLSGDRGFADLGFLTALTNCRSLQKLGIDHNRLGGVLPHSIGNFSDSLQMIAAFDNQIIGPIPESIGAVRSLISLDLGDNNISGTIPSTIGDLQNLQRLFLLNNQIGGSIPQEICNLRNLGELGLQENRLTGPIPHCIGSLIHLQDLNLSNNLLTSTIPASYWTLENLIYMDISKNSFHGNLPSKMKMSRVTEIMDISGNQITGKIPPILWTFESLIYLNMSNNSFHGTIPDSFGDLQSLEWLDLSYNNLSGLIPKSLESLNHLKYLNLSYNHLSGEIPNGGTFVKFAAESFLGNEELCGELLLKPCSPQNSKARHILLKGIVSVVGAVLLILVCLLCILRAFKHKNKNPTPTSSDTIQIPEFKMITYHELRRATNDFSEANLLGIGSYGSVYKGTISDGTVVAVKVLNPMEDGAFKSFDAECKVWRTTRHRNLVKVITSCSNPDFRALIMEYMSNGSLEKWLYYENCNLNLLQRITIMIDVATALDYLHHGQPEPVVHCDLKPSNILLDEDMVAHVGDFGIAKILPKAVDAIHTNTLGTIGYVAPEYGSEGRVSVKGDIYSYGIMMLEIVTGNKPIDEMFSGEVRLREWVSASFPNASLDVVDCVLKPKENNTRDIGMVQGLLVSLLEIGLECSREIPEERMDIKDVIAKLTQMKLKILHGQRYRSVFVAS